MVKQIRKLMPEQKLLLSLRLYHSAKELKTAAMKKFYPKKSDKEIEKRVKELFSNARY